MRDLLILTFMSIRGRQQGDPNAANKFGEIFVALFVSLFLKLTTRNGEDEAQLGGRNEEEEEKDEEKEEEEQEVDIPIPL
jgi:hypothetical protein